MRGFIFNRRSFIKAAIVGTMLLLGKPAFARELFEDERPLEGHLILHNTRTNEKLDVIYRSEDGEYDDGALAEINHFMRCHYNDEETAMDVRVIEYLNALDKTLGGNNLVTVVSAYRSKDYNTLLRKRMRRGRVAKNSLHQYGMAVDLRIPDVPLKQVKKTALSLQCGGVGYYPRSGFVHIDSGRFRHW